VSNSTKSEIRIQQNLRFITASEEGALIWGRAVRNKESHISQLTGYQSGQTFENLKRDGAE
jgi:hypothetical protein